MTDGIDTLVQPVQSPGFHPAPDPVPADSGVAQLTRRHCAVLTSSDGGDALVRCVPFCVYMT